MLAHWDKNDLKIIAQAKERLLLHYIDENEVLYKILSQRAEDLSQKNQDLEKLSLGIIANIAMLECFINLPPTNKCYLLLYKK
jgi:hypothetical protein